MGLCSPENYIATSIYEETPISFHLCVLCFQSNILVLYWWLFETNTKIALA